MSSCDALSQKERLEKALGREKGLQANLEEVIRASKNQSDLLAQVISYIAFAFVLSWSLSFDVYLAFHDRSCDLL